MPKKEQLDVLTKHANDAVPQYGSVDVHATGGGSMRQRLVNDRVHLAPPIPLDQVDFDHPPPPLPESLYFDSGTINFSGGTPVTGWGNVKLYQNGNYEFRGHFHDSGLPSFDCSFTMVIVDADGNASVFAAGRHVCGALEVGDRDGDWSDHGNKSEIAQHWAALCRGNHWHWKAATTWDWELHVKQIIDGAKVAGEIIKAVLFTIALF